MLAYPLKLQRGVLLRRYKRFLADVRLDDGSETTAHCANPGRMIGCSDPGSPVWLLPRNGPGLPFRLEIVDSHGVLVGVNPLRANDVVEQALHRSRIAELSGWCVVRREATLPSRLMRADFLLSRGKQQMWLEVKSVTLVEDGVALFPDAVTERGRRHLHCLSERLLHGDAATCLFLVQRAGAQRVAPAAHIDLAYAEVFASAEQAGVGMLACEAEVSPQGISLGRPLPVHIT